MKVLVASSGSQDESDDPISAAASFPWPVGSEIRVLTVAHVIEPAVVGVGPGMVSGMADVHEIQQTADAGARTAASNAAAQLQHRGLQAHGIIMEGDPETAITDYARSWGADLIVVGTHQRSSMERLFLGSVSQSVVKHSPCPVLLIKHDAAA